MKAIIVGAGIGGLATALFLSRIGVTCEVFEQSSEIREIGVGITLMPHAVAQLRELGLLPALDAIGIRSEHLYYRTRRGQLVWDEPRGLKAGAPAPQFFVHRGQLQSMLYQAVLTQLGIGAVRLGARLSGFDQTDAHVRASFVARDGSALPSAEGDILVACDGLHSVARETIAPGEGGPIWNGLMMWRGAAEWPAFRGGASLQIAGGVEAKFVAYPIARGARDDLKLTNWVAIARAAEFGATPRRREDWARIGLREDLEAALTAFSFEDIDFRGLCASTAVFWEYPMCDRDPIAHWTLGRATLLGDAAHPMYPMGANGASQAILDARCLMECLAAESDPGAALLAYENVRIPQTSEIVRMNRIGGPESVIDAVEARAPDGFADVDAVLGRPEREKIVRSYLAKTAFTDRFLAPLPAPTAG